MRTRRLISLIAAAALTGVVAAAPAAARPPASAAAVLSGPVTAQVGATYTVSGAGFTPGAVVPLEIGEADGCCIALNMIADGWGAFAYAGDVWAPGTYRVRAMTQRNGGRWKVAAYWSFEAYP
jgi:hypothetical protein